MLSKIQIFLDKQVENIQNFHLYTPVLGLGRSLLAFSLLGTLIFSDTNLLFDTDLKKSLSSSVFPLQAINLFVILKSNLLLAKISSILVLVLVIAGYYPQLTSFLHWYISFSFLNSSLDIEGGDQIMTSICLLLIPVCIADPRRNHWSKTDNRDRNIFGYFWFWLIKIQVSVIYLHSSIGKFPVKEWTDGTVLYYWINHPIFGTYDWLRKILNPFFLNEYIAFYSSWIILIFELCLGIGLFFDAKYKKSWFFLGVLFHFCIIILHGLFSFFITMAGGLVFYFLIDYYNERKNWNIKNHSSFEHMDKHIHKLHG